LLTSSYNDDGKGHSLRRLYLERDNPMSKTKKSTVEKASHHAALAALLEAVIGKNGEAPSGAQVQKLNDWLHGIETLTLVGVDKKKTLKLLIG